MTVVLMEGWDLETVDRGWVTAYSTGNGNNTNSGFVSGRIGGKAWRFSVGSSFQPVTGQQYKAIPTPSTEMILGFALNVDEGAYSVYDLRGTPRDIMLVGVSNGSIFVGGIGVSSANLVTLYGASGALIGTTDFQIVPGTWNYFELRVKINGASGEVELRINGGASSLGVVTDSNGSATIQHVQILSKSTSGTFPGQLSTTTDDIYVVDCTTGSAPTNTFLGDSVITTLVPEGDGANTDWTPSAGSNWEDVDEIPADGDTSYVSSNNVGDVDTYETEDLGSSPPTVYAIQANLYAKKDSAGTREIAAVVRDGGTDYVGATKTLSTSYIYYSEIMEENPGTSSPWSVSEINADEFGVKVVT